MISFYPGPSKVYAQIPQYVKEAHDQGILSINHRSAEFVVISKATTELLKQKLNIPNSHMVFYVSSATESWEIIAQSLIKEKSAHFFNGAFGEKWHAYTQRVQPNAGEFPFGFEDQLTSKATDADVVCITQNETSNGTQVSNVAINEIKSRNPQALIAVDATSSMAGIELDFSSGDVWYASVQKCFGLPAGMAVFICSPKAIERAMELNRRQYYNSLPFMIDNALKHQTTHTPNVLGIYLLMRTLQDRPEIKKVDKITRERFSTWESVISQLEGVDFLIKNYAVRSSTVIPLKSSESTVELIKQKAKEAGFILGNGYGAWKANTFRIANFPALTNKEISALQAFLKEVLK